VLRRFRSTTLIQPDFISLDKSYLDGSWTIFLEGLQRGPSLSRAFMPWCDNHFIHSRNQITINSPIVFSAPSPDRELTCDGVECAEGKVCKIRRNQLKCVCKVPCSRRLRKQGPICGSDGMSYKHVCHLRRAVCRKHYDYYRAANYSATSYNSFDFDGDSNVPGIAYFGNCTGQLIDPGELYSSLDYYYTQQF
jgi:hypothetical protein